MELINNFYFIVLYLGSKMGVSTQLFKLIQCYNLQNKIQYVISTFCMMAVVHWIHDKILLSNEQSLGYLHVYSTQIVTDTRLISEIA